MSIRNLDFLFKPRSIALIGASREPFSVGAVVARNLFNAGFRGPIMPVNPRFKAVEGVLAYPDVDSLPVDPDLAVIATPPETIPPLIDALGRRGARAAVVITAGFDEANGGNANGGGEALRQAMLAAAKPYTLRVMGPDCIGVLVPAVGLNTSIAPVTPKPGHLAFVAQSGGVVASILDWATTRGIGFSHFASLGDMADVDFGDLLDYLAGEMEVRGILLYMEGVTDARKFMSAARAAARVKPVIVIKAGRFAASRRAGTGRRTVAGGDDRIYDAAFHRAGMLRVGDFGDLFGAVETLGMGRIAKGDRLAILTNGGGVGILATDALLEAGGRLATLSPETIAALDAFLPPAWSRSNPADLTGAVPAPLYGRALALLLQDRGADAVLVLHSPTGIVPPLDAARAVVGTITRASACVLTCWLGETAARDARRCFTEHRVPTYDTPERAIRAFMHIVTYRRNQEALTQTPPSVPEVFQPDTDAARRVIGAALAAGRAWLSEPETQAVLEAYRIPVAPIRVALDPRAAAAAAAAFAAPVALKILSPDIRHKSEVDGVVLDLRGPAAVGQAAELLLARAAERRPDARITGFQVQPMVHRPGAIELMIGVGEDPQFGPVIVFGHGGTASDIIGDTAVALPPLNMHLARDAIFRTRVARLLGSTDGRPAMAIDDIALALIKVSQLVIDFAEVAELAINPLLADAYGVMAIDARMRIRPASGPATRRLAIRPYPKELEEMLALPDGRTFLLRPVLPEDEPAFQDLFQKLTPDDVRMRFFAPKKSLSHPLAARMTQIDYDREMALVLAEPGTPGHAPIYGVVHIAADPDGDAAEYAIMLRSDMSGLGLGPLLMRRIIDYSRARGLKEIFGEVLRENKPMLKVCQLFKFTRSTKPDDPGTIEVRLRL